MTRRGLFGLLSLPWFAPEMRYSLVPAAEWAQIVGGNTLVPIPALTSEVAAIMTRHMKSAGRPRKRRK